MEPRIQYAKTGDGVSIAYYRFGSGDAVVFMPPIPFRHLELRWQHLPDDRAYAEACVQNGRSCVQFDPRGMGLSSRNVSAFSLDAFVLDLEAVVDELGLRTIDLVATSYSCPIAIKYASVHPERVPHLILNVAIASMIEALDTPPGRAIRALRSQDWDVYTESSMQMAYGWAGAERSRAMTTVLQGATTRHNGPAIFEALDTFDVTDLLPTLTTPTLATYPRHSIFISAEHSRSVAAAIPNAHLIHERPLDELLPALHEFLGVRELDVASDRITSLPPSQGASGTHGTAIILFADIADSTALTERLGDAAFRAKGRELDGALRTIIRENGGTCIDAKTLGDGVLAVFTSARQAIEAALACGRAGEDGGLPLHLGLHAGDVIHEDDPDGRRNVYGGAVNIASRISGLSAPGEVLVSDTVRSLARTSAGVTFEDRGEQSLKGVGEPVRVWAVREGD